MLSNPPFGMSIAVMDSDGLRIVLDSIGAG